MRSPLCGCSDVRMFVCNELISETTPTDFLKLGMKLGDNKGNDPKDLPLEVILRGKEVFLRGKRYFLRGMKR